MTHGLPRRYTIKRPPDGSWGVLLEDGSWTGMVGMVNRKVSSYTAHIFSVSDSSWTQHSSAVSLESQEGEQFIRYTIEQVPYLLYTSLVSYGSRTQHS